MPDTAQMTEDTKYRTHYSWDDIGQARYGKGFLCIEALNMSSQLVDWRRKGINKKWVKAEIQLLNIARGRVIRVTLVQLAYIILARFGRGGLRNSYAKFLPI